MASLGNGQILENGLKLGTTEEPLMKKLKSEEAENICKSLLKDKAFIAGCGLVLPEVPISGKLLLLITTSSNIALIAVTYWISILIYYKSHF